LKSKPSVRNNIIANFAGKAWRAVFALAFVPIYVSIMGVEVYGLLGMFISISAIFALLDLGMGATLGRELARLSVIENSEQESRNLTRTFETIYWCMGILSGLIMILLAPFITEYWVNSGSIDNEIVEQSFMILGVMLAFQWPVSIYTGGLSAIQRQVADNVIRSIIVVVKHVGAVAILLFISPSVLGFFMWHAFISIIKAIILGKWLWKLLPKTEARARFDKSLIIKNWRYASGTLGISLVVLILVQADKIILSKMLTLEVFGYYMLAWRLAQAIQGFRTPILSALFPRYTQLAESAQEGLLIGLYHKGCQYLSTIIIPMAMIIAFFSTTILMIWLHDEVVVENTHLILTVLIIGTAINAVIVPPYMMQLAHGWTKLALYTNVVAVICVIPLTIWLTSMYQGVGAAWAWLILNLGYLIFHVPFMHRKILKTEMWNWYLTDILLPVIVASSVAYISYLAIPIDLSVYLLFPWDVIAYLISVILIGLSLPLTRKEFLHYRGLAFEKIGRMR